MCTVCSCSSKHIHIISFANGENCDANVMLYYRTSTNGKKRHAARYCVFLSHTIWSLAYLIYALRMYVKRYNLMYSVFVFNGVTSFRFSFVHSLGGSSLSFSICSLLSCLFDFFSVEVSAVVVITIMGISHIVSPFIFL